MKTVEVNGESYTFNQNCDCVIKRGLIDPYLISDSADNEWVVIDDYIVWSARLSKIIVIPRWFITDLASIPQGLQWLIKVNEQHRLAAIVHDFLYSLNDMNELHVTREECDLVLNDFCLLWGVPLWKRLAIYSAVRVGGKIIFETKSKRPFFIPPLHREWYRAGFPKLDLPFETGTYLPV